VSDDQILEVGGDVLEVPEADDIPTVDAVELVEEEPAPAPAAAAGAPAGGEAPAEEAPGAHPAEETPWSFGEPLEAEAPLPEVAPGPAPPAEVAAPGHELLSHEPEPAAPAAAEHGPERFPAAHELVPVAREAPPAPEAARPAEDLGSLAAGLGSLPREPAAAEPPAPTADLAASEPVPLDSLTIDEAPLEEARPAPPRPPPPPPPPAERRILAGVHRVVVHTVEGQVKRGSLSDPDLAAGELHLAPQPSGTPEPLPAERVRAIFFMLGAGEKPPPPDGVKVRVTFKDGRQVAGFSPDYDPSASGFFMIPADTRTNTARIWVYRGAVRQVAVS
jgi:hypothetical protein